MTSDFRGLGLAEDFSIGADLPPLDSLVVVPDPESRRVGLGRAVTGARVVSTLSEQIEEPRLTLVATSLPMIHDQLQVALKTEVPEIDVLVLPTASAIEDLLAVVVPTKRAITRMSIDPEAVLIRFGLALQAQRPEAFIRLEVARTWITSLQELHNKRVDAAEQYQKTTSIARDRETQERAVTIADAKQLAQALQRTKSSLAKAEEENKRLARRYQGLAGSKLGKLTLFYWRVVARLRKKRTLV